MDTGAVEVSVDGGTVALVGSLGSALAGGAAVALSAATGTEVWRMPAPRFANILAVARDGALLAVADQVEPVVVVGLRGREGFRVVVDRIASSLAFSDADIHLLAMGAADGSVGSMTLAQ